MSNAVLTAGTLQGTVRIPSSKSTGHRAMLCAALAHGKSILSPLDPSRDMEVTLNAIRAIGALAEPSGGTFATDCSLNVTPGKLAASAEIDCGESGSSLRFLIPICAALGIDTTFTGHGRLPERPIGVYLDLLPQHGVICDTTGGLPLHISGRLTPGRFLLPGDISSQFITGLLLSLPLLNGDSDIILTTELESAAYVTMTEDTMRDFGVEVTRTPGGWHIRGNQKYCAQNYRIEGDWSQAAFFLAAATLGGDIRITGLKKDSSQGDRKAESLFRKFGADIRWEKDVLHARPGVLRGIKIDASQIPDLVPALAATAALAQGETKIYNAARLRIKESDRLAAMADGINRLGGNAQELPDGLLIHGVPRLRGASAEGCNDHRIVMALAIAALRAEGKTNISDAESIQKSYTGFFEDYNRLGGNAHVHLG